MHYGYLNILLVLCLADEANRLMNWKELDPSETSLHELLDFLVAISKQKHLAHVVLSSSDFFLTAWLLGSKSVPLLLYS